MDKNKIYLIGILIIAFLVRLIPSKNLSMAGYDSYLHHDIVLRIVNEGFGVISTHFTSLMGLSPYSYPPLFHIIAAVPYQLFHNELVFYIIPAIFGVAAIYVFYKIALEIFLDENIAILSALLFAFVPSFVTRTSVFIPESLGVFLSICLLYVVVKYIKSIPNYEDINIFGGRGIINVLRGNMIYILMAVLIFGIYLLTHRGWFFFGTSFLILAFTFTLPTFKKRPVSLLIFLALAAAVLIFIQTSDYSYLFDRFQGDPVTILGFPKWVGVIQLVLGLYGIIIFIKSKNPIYKFLSLWAAIFLVIGTYSFRFRDPYAAIPVSLMAGYILSVEVIPKLNELKIKLGALNPLYKKLIPLTILLLLIIPVAQGAFSAYSFVNQPTKGEMEAFNWINQNTALNATIVTGADDGYFLIGNTHRKDVILWKKVYQGFFGEPPSVTNVFSTQRDVATIFRSSLKNEVYSLMNKYNVTYVYISPRMYKSQEPDYGLGESVSYDTHFKTEFANGESAIYKYIKDPTLKPPKSENINVSGTYSKTVDFIEKFWNGYSYSEFGKGYMDQNNLDYEDYGYYKGNYNLNAQIIYLYNYIYGKTSDGNLKNRTDYLTRWLQYKQMDEGAFISLNPPAEYTVGSMEVLYPLMKTDYNNTEKNGIIKKGTSFIDAQVKDSGINVSNKQTKDLLEGDYSESKTNALVSGMYPAGKEKIVYDLIAKQGTDGSWYWESYKNIAILKGLSLYYKETNDKKVKESIIKGSNWLKANQNSDGKFKDDKEDLKPYNLKQYADAFYIYETVGEKDYANRTLQYIKNQKINDDITPLTSYLSLLFDLSDFLGMEESLNIINKLL